jgi:hypothetical protein
MPGQKREARLRASRPGHDEFSYSNAPIYGFNRAIATPSRAN